MDKIEETENGNNWSVFVFKCLNHDWHHVLIDLFELIEQIDEADIPHFSVRYGTPKLTISFRILRDETHERLLEEKIAEFMDKKGIKYRINPEGKNHFGHCHAWIRKDKKNPKWPRKRCEALNRLSRFVVSIAEDDLFDPENRFEWGHLTINMLGLQESIVGRGAAFTDMITGKISGVYVATIYQDLG